MSLARFFVVAASTALAIVLLTNAAYYFIIAAQSERCQRQVIHMAARSVAQNIHGRLSLLTKTLEVIAQAPKLAELLETGDAAQLVVEAERLRQQLPGSLRVRLLKPDTDAPEQTQKPLWAMPIWKWSIRPRYPIHCRPFIRMAHRMSIWRLLVVLGSRTT